MLPVAVDHTTVYATKRGIVGLANNGVSGAATFTAAATTNVGFPGTQAAATALATGRATTILVGASAVGRLAPITAVTGIAIDAAR